MLMMAITACSQKAPCVETVYPKLEALNKVPKVSIAVKDGTIDQNGTKKAFKTIKALRVSENYYYRLIGDYRKEFLK